MTFGVPVKWLPVTYSGILKVKEHNKWLTRQFAKDDQSHKMREVLLFFSSTFSLPPSQQQAAQPNNNKNSNKFNQESQQPSTSKTSSSFDDESTTSAPSTGTGTTSTPTWIDIPGQHDILVGRGKPLQDHPGNVAMRHFIQLHLDDYRKATKPGQKTALTKQIAHAILYPLTTNYNTGDTHGGGNGGGDVTTETMITSSTSISSSSSINVKNNYENTIRPTTMTMKGRPRFLKQNENGWWVQVSEREAIAKVLKTFKTSYASSSTSGSGGASSTSSTTTTELLGRKTSSNTMTGTIATMKATIDKNDDRHKRLRMTTVSSLSSSPLSVPNPMGTDKRVCCPGVCGA